MRCAESGFGVMTSVGTCIRRQTAAKRRGFAGSGHIVGTFARGCEKACPIASNSAVPISRSVRDARNGCCTFRGMEVCARAVKPAIKLRVFLKSDSILIWG